MLLEPPWQAGTAPKPKPTVLKGLLPPEAPPSLTWAPGEMERFAEEGNAAASGRELEEEAQQNFVDVMVHGKARLGPYPWAHASYLLQVSPARAVQIFNHVPAERWIGVSALGLPGCLLARHGLWVLPGLVALARRAPQHALPWLGPVFCDELVPIMAAALAKKSVHEHATLWLRRHAERAAPALIPVALGKPGKPRTTAESAVRCIAEANADAVLAAATDYGSEARRAVEAMLTRKAAPAPIKKPRWPKFVAAKNLPVPHTTSGEPMPAEALENLVLLLTLLPTEPTSAEMDAVRAAYTPASLGELAWAITSAWMLSGAQPKDKWAFFASGHLGDDATAAKLAKLIRAWPGQAMHARAVMGLDVLALIGSDAALLHIFGISQRIRYKALQDRAQEKIDAIAAARGLDTEQLADRLVPDLGLDTEGTLSFDLGARQVTAELTSRGVLRLFDDGGELRALSPKRDDDPDRAKQAQAAMTALKKQLGPLVAAQSLRLELAMASQRHWSEAEHRALILAHPVVGRLALGLIWSACESGEPVHTFRVHAGRYVDVEHNELALAPNARIAVAHPLSLSHALCAQWRQALRDAGVEPPFDQLERAVFVPSAVERLAWTISDYEGTPVPAGAVIGLRDRGWHNGAPQISDAVWWMERTLGNGVVAQLRILPGLVPGVPPEAQELGLLSFLRDGDGVAIGEVDPILLSETVRDVNRLAGAK